jgi:hypothetical protein
MKVNTEQNAEATTTEDTDFNVGLSGMGNIKGLLAMGKSLSCTFLSEGKTGTLFFADGKMSGTFKAGANTSNIISDGKNYYAWTGSQGVKMSLDSSAQSQVQTDPTSGGRVDIDQTIEYACYEWKKDETKFTLPKTVKFIDVQSVLNGQIKVSP